MTRDLSARSRTDGSSGSGSGEEDVDGLSGQVRGLDRVVDLGPRRQVVRERVSGVGVLVQDDGVGDGGAKSVGDPDRGRKSTRGQYTSTALKHKG